jgi:hypothetical protein
MQHPSNQKAYYNPFRDCGPRQSKKHPSAYTKTELIDLATLHGIPAPKARAMTVPLLCHTIAQLTGNVAPAAVAATYALPAKAPAKAPAKPRAPKRDPNAPRQPRKLSAYNLFMRDELERLKRAHPEVAHPERFKQAAKAWATSPLNPKRLKMRSL